MPEDKKKNEEVEITPTDQETKNQQEIAQLKQDYEQTIEDTQEVYDGQINGLADLAGTLDERLRERRSQDENYQKRENAYRYIAGIGDAISGVANLVGTAHGASNQEQTYNAPALVQKAEESRKARKLEMDKITERIDEMRAREKELRGAKDLKTAELRAQENKAVRELKMKQDEIAREEAWKKKQQEIAEANAQANLNRSEATLNNSNKPKSTSSTRYVTVAGADGKMGKFDVTNFKNFDADYQKALDKAIVAGTSGLTEDEIKAYNSAKGLAKTDSNKAIKEFFRTHTYRQNIIESMMTNPIFNGL